MAEMAAPMHVPIAAGPRRPRAPQSAPDDDPPHPDVADEGLTPATTPPATLETLLEQLGPSVIDVVAAPRGLRVPIRAPVIYDPSMPAVSQPGDILLAVGIAQSSARAITLVQQGARDGAVAAVFKEGENLDVLAATADRVGLAVLVIPSDLGWDDVHGMITAVIAASMLRLSHRTAPLHRPPLAALSARATGVGANLPGAVTIHNHHMQIIAFSTLDDPMDELAERSILRR